MAVQGGRRLGQGTGHAIAAYAKGIEGTVTLRAKGAGVAVLRGDGEVTIEGRGAEVVIVSTAETLIAVFGWLGQIYAQGEEMVVRMLGGEIEFTAEETGTAFLGDSEV